MKKGRRGLYRRRSDPYAVLALLLIFGAWAFLGYMEQTVIPFLQQINPFWIAVASGTTVTFLCVVLARFFYRQKVHRAEQGRVWQQSTLQKKLEEKQARILQVEAEIKNEGLSLQRTMYKSFFELSPGQFEQVVAKLYEQSGYETTIVGGANDKGIDILFRKDGREWGVQCKRYAPERNVGPGEIREFAGALDGRGLKRGIFVASSGYTDMAREASRNGSAVIELVDGEGLNKLRMIQASLFLNENINLKQKQETLAQLRQELEKITREVEVIGSSPIRVSFTDIRWWGDFSGGQQVVLLVLLFLVCWAVLSGVSYFVLLEFLPW